MKYIEDRIVNLKYSGMPKRYVEAAINLVKEGLLKEADMLMDDFEGIWRKRE